MQIWYVVFLCGCTDCFAHAAFIDKEDAEKWQEANSVNPEGSYIKEMTPEELSKLSWD